MEDTKGRSLSDFATLSDRIYIISSSFILPVTAAEA